MAIGLPRLPVDRILRKGARSDAPLIVAAKAGNALCVYALEARAQKLGLYPGQPLANAQAMVAGLDVVQADLQADARLLTDIADWCDRFTPFVALDSPHALLLDITGVAHLFGGEAAMLAHVQKAIAAQGFTVTGAIAASAAAARALSRYAPDTIAQDAKILEPLPVDALPCEAVTIHALRRAGLKTIGQVAARGPGEQATRVRREFLARPEAQMGGNKTPKSPRRALPDYNVEHCFADPVTAETAIAVTLQALAARLAEMLEQHGEGARVLEAFFFRADGKRRHITVQLGAPTRDPAVILRLFREKLGSLSDPLDPGFGFDLIRLEAALTQRAQARALGFDANENAQRETAFLIDRLSARFGAQRVLRFHPQDTHIPEAECTAIPAQYAPPAAWPGKNDGAPARPLRLFEYPEPIEAMATVPDGPPFRFRWRRVLHEVVLAEGPERIAMEWWRSAKPTRDYFRVEDDKGRRFWLYRDGPYGRETGTPRWFMHGVFA